MDDGYELIDAGDRRRLERFGERLVDRPAPAAGEPRRSPGLWAAPVTFRAGRGWAAVDNGLPPEDDVPVRIAGVTVLTALASGGQVGLFPEHARNADWTREAIARRGGGGTAARPSVLNLFAYTGLLTLVSADAGAAVTHLDASRPAVQWARRNAAANGLEDRPIRWIVDDALAFLRREARRGQRYDGLVLDPPSYGHGGSGGHAGAFRLDEDLDELLGAALDVATPDAFWLVSTHTVGWDADRLGATLAWALGATAREVESVALGLEATSGARLALGAAARFDPLLPDAR